MQYELEVVIIISGERMRLTFLNNLHLLAQSNYVNIMKLVLH